VHLDVGQVGRKILLAHAERPSPQRRQPPRPRQHVVLHQDVIGNGDRIELALESGPARRPVSPEASAKAEGPACT